MGKNQWVSPHKNGWSVKSEGSKRASHVLPTQGEAIGVARSKAINEKSDVIIKNRENRIRDRDSYGNDPCPPKDNRH